MGARPRLVAETPAWWNPRGQDMVTSISGTLLTGEKADLAFRSAESVAASVRISQVFKRDKYTLSWRLSHKGGLDPAFTAGAIETNSLELRRMFCMDDGIEKADRWIAKRYGATTAVQGKFLRLEHYLNISGPGTGKDGDANVSMFVSDGILKSVRDLLAINGHMPA